jgi:hypothetical protein
MFIRFRCLDGLIKRSHRRLVVIVVKGSLLIFIVVKQMVFLTMGKGSANHGQDGVGLVVGVPGRLASLSSK